MSVTIDPRDVPRCAERLRTALPLAVSEAFGGSTEAAAVEPGTPVAHIAGLGPGHHLHLEFEALTGREEPRRLLLVLRPEETQRLFGLEPVPPQELGEPDVQLRLLSEFTEGGEALAAALSRTLAAGGVLITLRVSGASLETADASPAAVTASLGSDAVSFAVTLHRPANERLRLVLGAPPDLVAVLATGVSEPVAGGLAPGRAADPAASRPAAAPRAPVDAVATPPAAGLSANPLVFPQLEPAPETSSRQSRSVDLILDVTLQVRVELGSTRMTVEEVLNLAPGSVVELDRLAGEPVDIVVNDRLIARGEVVVVEENFGVRVTEIVSPRHRAMALG
jgi:flagellar motor switch protein FliN